MPPHLPPELLGQILGHAVQGLTQQEAADATLYSSSASRSLVNPLLRSASLVARSWRPIAQLALVNHGVVPPEHFADFLELAEAVGVRAKLVKLRLGPSRGLDEPAEGPVWDMMSTMVLAMPNVREVGWVGCGGWEAKWEVPVTVRPDAQGAPLVLCREMLAAKRDRPPAPPTIVLGYSIPGYHTNRRSEEPQENVLRLLAATRHLTSFEISLADNHLADPLLSSFRAKDCQRFRFECRSYRGTGSRLSGGIHWSRDLPCLTHLTLPLDFAHHSPHGHGAYYPPSLTSLDLLSFPVEKEKDVEWQTPMTDTGKRLFEGWLEQTLERLPNLVVLTLPSEWKWGAVDVICRGRSVELNIIA